MGSLFADNGSNWYLSGAPDPRWNDDTPGQLKTIPGSAFEAVLTVDSLGNPIRPSSVLPTATSRGGHLNGGHSVRFIKGRLTFSTTNSHLRMIDKGRVVDLHGRILPDYTIK